MKSLRMAAAMAALIMTVTVSAHAMEQDIDGRVVDSKGEALPFVNVVLLSLPDSAFVQGSTTDENGVFQITSANNGALLKVSCIGYETQYLPIGNGQSASANGITIRLREDAQLMGEVEVKGTLPKTIVKGDAMRTIVDGTILEKAGRAADMLSKIPSLEAEREGEITVLGRGAAEVYINGRRVQDIRELSRLSADQIQYVDVIHNPSARYAASTKAVVRIQLKKAQGEGISFQDYAQGMYQYGYTLHNNIDVNYRTGGLDVTASLWAGRYGHSKSLQGNDLIYNVGNDHILARSNQEMERIWKGWSPQLQVNYMVDENHSFGAFYKYDRHPDGTGEGPFITDNYVNGVFTEHSESYIYSDDSFRKHIFNAYYNGKVGQLGIDLNVDGLFDDTKTPGSTRETTTAAGGAPINRSIENNTNSSNNFWASKLILSYPVWKGNLSAGGEYSYNHRKDAYSYNATDAVPVKATDTEINESSSAAFVEYGRPFGKLFAQIGLRYEYLTNDYYDFGKRQDEICRNYGDWFPTAVIAMPLGQVQLSLSYRQDIERPHYSNLTSQTVYINRYTYQSGNPYLKPTYTHSFVMNAAYKWASMTVNYGHTKDNVTLATEPYPDITDPLVSLVRPINGSDGYNSLTISPSIRPTFKLTHFSWHPIWAANLILQDYETPCSDGTIIKLNRPFANFIWNNDFEMPKQWRINLSAQYSTKGDYTNFRVTRTRFNMHMGVQRDFSLRQYGQLTLDLRCYDIFQTSKSETTIYGMRDITSCNPARRTFTLDLTWKFNEARSKYRGSGAGEKQKARM